jgi:peptidoglycan/xylan/chitin deacetylase (PgdA/CDA1 family)
MKRHRILRFLIVAFVLGAFFGLVSGLAFGGPDQVSSGSTPQPSSGTAALPPEVQGSTTSTVAAPLTAERARAIGANELGYIPVLSYHKLGTPEGDYTRAPENFRQDLATLAKEGFQPINVRDLVAGNIDIPAGKSPVVLTFDDASPDQYRILDDGSLDPDCAVGILQAAVEAGDWAPRATFFCDFDVPPFGQADRVREKLRNLVDWGYEVGSHTMSHLNMKKASPAESRRELAESQRKLEELIGGGYSVVSLAVPYAAYPDDDALLAKGESDGVTYAYAAALTLGGVPSYSPFSTDFRPYHIPRIMVTGQSFKALLATLKASAGLRYISDGDPLVVSAPQTVAAELGELLPDLGRPVIRY